MILKYVTRTTKILEDCDDARTAFIKETKNLQENIEDEISQKCFYSFLVGAIVGVGIIGGSIYFFSADKGGFMQMLFGAM